MRSCPAPLHKAAGFAIMTRFFFVSLATSDRIWVGALAVADLVPLPFWGAIEGWARHSLTLYAGR